MSLRWFVTLVGGALLLVGLVLGSIEVTADRVYSQFDSFSCGTALAPDIDAAARRDQLAVASSRNLGLPPIGGTAAACEQAIGSRPAFAWVLLGGGAILLLGGVVVRPRTEESGSGRRA